MLKAIAGHTSARGICRYLTKKDRALAGDYLNIDAPEGAKSFDWAAVMDETRRTFGNDLPWRGKRVRTYKHYVVSPDPKDGAGLSALRELATAWAEEHFSEFEVAIVYHDDNERGIPHAHVVVNNTNIETGRRLQDPDPKALAESLQSITERQGLTALRPPEATGVAARAQRRNPKRAPETYRSEYVRSAEQELVDRGKYSWTADIRAACGLPARCPGARPSSGAFSLRWASPSQTTRRKRSGGTGYTPSPTVPRGGYPESAWGLPTGATASNRSCAREASEGSKTLASAP